MDNHEDQRIEDEIHKSAASNDPFAAAVRTTRMPMIITDPHQSDNPIVFVNDAFLKLTGYDRHEIIGRNCRFLQGAATNQEDVTRIRNAISQREAIEIDLLNYRKDRSTFWNRLLVCPVFDGDGELTYFFASQFDVSPERHRVSELKASHDSLENEVERRMFELMQHEQRTRFALNAAGLGLWTLDLATKRLVVSQQCKVNYGYPLDQPMGFEDAQRIILPEDLPRWNDEIAAAIERRSDFAVEYRVRGEDDAIRWVEIRGQINFDAADVPMSLMGVSSNITARKEAEEHRSLLAREMGHRVKNSLAAAQSVFTQSLRSASSLDEAREIVFGRMRALGNAQDVLTQEGHTTASLLSVVRMAIEPFDGGAFTVDGPPVTLGPRAVSAFSLALHELSTNASKYGALSVPDGSVLIDWEVDEKQGDPRLSFRWREIEGPVVVTPQRRGFGSRLIETSLAAEVQGEAVIDYRPEGILYVVTADLEALAVEAVA